MYAKNIEKAKIMNLEFKGFMGYVLPISFILLWRGVARMLS
jgi:hypothetical protein